MNDLTIVYYTANIIPWKFLDKTWHNLRVVAENIPIIIISQKAFPYEGQSRIYTPEIKRSHIGIYRQALIGARHASTKYIALCEDDVLYTPSHFEYRPADGVFGYNVCTWGMHTWVKPAVFAYKQRRNLGQLICERDLFISAMEERFSKYPDETKIPIESWAEPGKYEKNLGIKVQQSEEFYSKIPNIMFFHETALSFQNLGKRKRISRIQATEIPYWGSAENVIKLYE